MDKYAADYSVGEPEARQGTAGRVALGVFAVAAAYFLWTEHSAHAIQYLPWGILLLCPLMHLFMHHDHGAHRGGDEAGPSSPGEGPAR